MDKDNNTYQILRSARRSISIRVTDNGIIQVRAPQLLPMVFIKMFLQSKKDWISDAVFKQITTKPKRGYEEGSILPFFGSTLRLHYYDGASLLRTDGTMLFPKKFSGKIKEHLQSWYVREAKRIITQRVRLYAEKINVSYKAVSIRDTTSRWGSCSTSGRINFCWRLILADVSIVDYVVIHELCHVRYPNHSHAFWDEVFRYCPDYRKLRTWLKHNGSTLQI